jgi:hypothetical protein
LVKLVGVTDGIFSQIVVRVRMKAFLSELRVKVLLMRIVLGLLFALLLSRFFLPGASMITKLILAGLLVLAAYGLEYFQRGRRA